MKTFTHIINPVKVGESSDLHIAQPITFKTMLKAKNFAKDTVNVNLVTTQYPEDHEIIPEYFVKTLDLNRSVLDLAKFDNERKLPLLNDILEKAVEFDTDYIIYTNTDISVLPHFYLFVNEKINEGYDAFVINRRTISKKHTIDSLYSAYSEIGINHPGIDCFIFKKELFNKLVLENICIGAKYIGLALYINLNLHANKFKEFDEEHVTFHIGNDRVWKNEKFNQYEVHNQEEYNKVKSQLEKEFDNVDKVINYALRYWKPKNELPKWKKRIIHFLTKGNGIS